MKVGESFGRVASQETIYTDELAEDRYDPAVLAASLVARHASPEESAEAIIDAYEEGLLTWADAILVAREVGA